jgi:tetratricopeptide (TPR) repeat protein
MSNPSVLSRKDMREPDRFQVVANQAASWLSARKKLVALVGGPFVLVVVVVGVVLGVQSSRFEAAGHATSELLAVVSAPVMEAPPAGTTAKTFPTEEAKNRAIVAEADKVLAAEGVSRATLLAVMAKADAHYGLKEWDAAAAQYSRFLADAAPDDSLRFLALEDLGLVAEEKGDLAGAAQAFERMAKEAPAYADRADLDRARVLAAAGKAEEARQILTKFGETHPRSMLGREAAQQLQQLGVK